MKALAIATLCFYPPDNWPPAFPTDRSIFSLKLLINSIARDLRKASLISSSVAVGLPNKTFYLIVVFKSAGS